MCLLVCTIRGHGKCQYHKTGCRRRQGPQNGYLYLWDNDLHGFGLKVTPAGSKVYLVQYRLGGRKGRTRRITIGRHGEITPTIARAEAKRLLGEVAARRDPAAERDKAKANKSLAVVLDQFMAEHVTPKLKASTAASYERIAMLYVRPSLGRRSVGEVTRPDIARLHHEMRAKPYQANRTLAMLSKFFGWAESMGLDLMALTHAATSIDIPRKGANAFSVKLSSAT